MTLRYHEFWQSSLDSYKAEPELATTMAQQLGTLKWEIGRGRARVREVQRLLDIAIDELYPYTDFNIACKELYYRYTSPKVGLLPKFDPVMLLHTLQQEERERKAKQRRKRTVKASKKKKPAFKLVKGKKAA